MRKIFEGGLKIMDFETKIILYAVVGVVSLAFGYYIGSRR